MSMFRQLTAALAAHGLVGNERGMPINRPCNSWSAHAALPQFVKTSQIVKKLFFIDTELGEYDIKCAEFMEVLAAH